tara:strand:+ start:1118 stop:1732 length:615 start_codon:yes stop_codon:yes gene_type:complete
MREINRILHKTIFLILMMFSASAESKIVFEGKSEAKVVVKVFSSLTCPACANWHSKIFYQMKKDFIDTGLVRFEHHPFPLDLAALNAEIILRCHVDNNKRFELLGKIYEKQSVWAVGSDINKINDSIKKIGSQVGLEDVEMDRCLKNDKSQDEILNQRIEAQKKYKIEATPTVIINDKKYTGKVEYLKFRKAIEKNLVKFGLFK